MAKFLEIQTNIFNVFGSLAWRIKGIEAYPREFEIVELTSDSSAAIRVSILMEGKGVNLVSVSGVVIIEIYSHTAAGPKIIATTSDTLDAFLVGKQFSITEGIVTQFFSSSLGISRKDAVNPRLSVTLYSINFQHNGVD